MLHAYSEGIDVKGAWPAAKWSAQTLNRLLGAYSNRGIGTGIQDTGFMVVATRERDWTTALARR